MGEKKNKTTGLTKKQKVFADGVLAGKSQTQAAVDAGFRQPTNYGSALMSRDHIREYLFHKFEEVGIDNDLVAMKMKDGMDAMSPPKKDGGKQYEDWFTRRLYLDMYFRLRGLYAPEKTEHVEKRIVINMTPELVKGLLDSGAIDSQELEYIKGEVIEGNQG